MKKPVVKKPIVETKDEKPKIKYVKMKNDMKNLIANVHPDEVEVAKRFGWKEYKEG